MNKVMINDFFCNQERIPQGMGSSKTGLIEKNAHFYHVVQQTFNKEEYFGSFDVAIYRQKILHEECIKNGILLIFSVTMPNHTHDVFLVSNWGALANVIRIVNRCVIKYIKKRYNASHKRGFDEMGKKVFAERPIYIPIQSIVQLFYLAKYIYDNPIVQGLDLDHTVSSFWAFEHEVIKPPYNPHIYEFLFGMTAKELTELCKRLDKKSFMAYAENKYGGLEKEEQDKILKIDPSLPWKYGEYTLPIA